MIIRDRFGPVTFAMHHAHDKKLMAQAMKHAVWVASSSNHSMILRDTY